MCLDQALRHVLLLSFVQRDFCPECELPGAVNRYQGSKLFTVHIMLHDIDYVQKGAKLLPLPCSHSLTACWMSVPRWASVRLGRMCRRLHGMAVDRTLWRTLSGLLSSMARRPSGRSPESSSSFYLAMVSTFINPISYTQAEAHTYHIFWLAHIQRFASCFVQTSKLSALLGF